MIHLKDWSDTEESSNPPEQPIEVPQQTENRIPIDSTIRPPERQPTYVESVNEYNFDDVQPAWWLNNNNTDQPEVEEFSEWIAMREMIWMFLYDPLYMDGQTNRSGFKFFAINTEDESVSVNPNVGVLGDRTKGIMLKAFAEIFTVLYKLRCVQNAICQRGTKSKERRAAPTTMQVYAKALKDFDKTIIDLATKLEKRLIEQRLDDYLTIVWLYNEFGPQIELMNHLFSIHTKVYVDYTEHEGSFL